MTWIKCSERMPEDDDVVMVYLANGHYCEDWVDKDTGDFLNYECLWADGKIPMQALKHGSYATHWMPLPAPPKEAPSRDEGRGSV